MDETKKVFDIGINIQLEEYDKSIIRYMQAGVMLNGKFNGIIYDYCGGGEYGEFYVLNGKECGIDDDNDSEYAINQIHPGIVEAIFEPRDLFTVYDDEMCLYRASKLLQEKMRNWPKGHLFCHGAPIEPMTVSMTIFPDNPTFEVKIAA